MCYTEEEAGLIDGVLLSYFAPRSVSEPVRRRYWETHRHLQQEKIERSDLRNIKDALVFLAPVFQGSRQTQKELLAILAKTDVLLSARLSARES